MEELATFLIISYWVGFIVASGVYRARAGLGFWSARLRVFGPTGVGLDWLALTSVKLFVWPIVLGVWLSTDRPEPRIVFNEKATARQQQAQAA